MKNYLILLFLFLSQVAYPQPLPTCTITANLYNWDGTPSEGAEIWVQKVMSQKGKLIVANPHKYVTDNTGTVELKVPRSTISDTVVAYIYSNVWGTQWGLYGWGGVPIVVPTTPTATLQVDNTLQPTTVVAVPTIALYDSLNNKVVYPDTLRIGKGLALITNPPPYNNYTIISTTSGGGGSEHGDSIHVTYNMIAGKAGADSVNVTFGAVNDVIAGKADADSVNTEFTTLHNIAAGKPSADSVHTALYNIDTDVSSIQDTLDIYRPYIYDDTPSGGTDTWEIYDSGGSYKVGAPSWTDTPGDTTIASIDNKGNLSLSGGKINVLLPLAPDNTRYSCIILGAQGDNQTELAFYPNSYNNPNLKRVFVMSSVRGTLFMTGNAYSHIWSSGGYNPFADGARLMELTGRGKLGIGVARNPANMLEVGGHISQHPDSTAYLGHVESYSISDVSTDDQIGGIVTITTDDSVQVTIDGVLYTDAIVVSYVGGNTPPTLIPYSNVYASNKLTIYGDTGRKVSYIRIRK